MKRLVPFVVAMLLPAAALAQTSRTTPPPAPTPVPTPTPAPRPMVVMPPVWDAVEWADMAEAARAASRVDADAIREQARAAAEQARDTMRYVDMDAIREQARAAADALQDANRELLRQPFHFDLPSMNADFDFQERFLVNRLDQGGDNGGYSSGLNALSQGQYERAITAFDRVVAQKSTRADGALYWKAYAQYKLARTEDALATIAQLRKDYAQSAYLNDARVLEADVRKASGQPVDPNAAANDDLKLLAIQGIMNADPARGIPLLEGVLGATNSIRLKQRAIYLLALSDDARAHQILMRYAKGGGTPDLQVEAIRYLATRRDKQTTSAELKEIYESTQDLTVKRTILSAYQSGRDKEALIAVINNTSTPVALRQSAVSGLSDLAAPQEVWTLYQKEQDKTLRLQMVSLFGSMNAIEQLQQVIRTEKDPEVRRAAIRRLGSQKADRTGAMLVELYGNETDKQNRSAVISALASQNNVDGLVAVAKKETSLDLKRDIVAKLSEMAPKSKAAADYLMEIIK